MLWYGAVILECCLFGLLWFKESLNLRWFCLFIGIDVLTSLLQFGSYRLGYKQISAWIWEVGVIAWVPLMPGAFYEAAVKYADGRSPQWRRHLLILSWWISVLFACKSAAFSRMFPLGNVILLWADCAAFVAWMWIFMVD